METGITSQESRNKGDESIARRLVELRSRLRLTQGEFAARLGVAKGSYVPWERAESSPSIRLVGLIRKEFGDHAALRLLDLPGGQGAGSRAADWLELAELADRVAGLGEERGVRLERRDLILLAGRLLELPEAARESAMADIDSMMQIAKRAKFVEDD
jgi:transcriptional regulator with XRE-family HTH domain